ncbi:MAG: hypothetical protein ACI87N_003180 [Flavobacteriales bacterium]|jgi:hypothetical protein
MQMKKIKTLGLLAIVFFATSAIQAQVSIGVNIGLPSIVVSGHYERGYEPQRRRVIYQDAPVVYENHRHYDDGSCCDDRRYEESRYENKKHHGKWKGAKKYKKRDYEDWDHHDSEYNDRYND